MTASPVRIAYRSATVLVSLGFLAVGVADLVRAPEVAVGLARLGYPSYFATILGTWELLGVAAILTPNRPRLQEWAYSGMFFTLSGAALSHAASGDPLIKVLVPIVLLGVVLVSWRLRPASQTTFETNDIQRAEAA